MAGQMKAAYLNELNKKLDWKLFDGYSKGMIWSVRS